MPLRYRNNPDDTFMRDLRPTQVVALERQPSCLAFCPHYPSLFIIGTYALKDSEGAQSVEALPFAEGDDGSTQGDTTMRTREAEQDLERNRVDRVGSLEVHLVHDEQVVPKPIAVRCRAAVMDVQWSPHRPDLVGCALADGTVAVYRPRMVASTPGTSVRLTLEARCRVAAPSVVVTAVAWHPVDDTLLAVTLADGLTELLRLTRTVTTTAVGQGTEHPRGFALEHRSTLLAPHDLEAWCLAMSPIGGWKYGLGTVDGSFVLHTGGDDGLIHTRPFPRDETITELDDLDDPPPARLGHRAGVTSMLLLPPSAAPGKSHLLLTGSYDEHVRVVDPIDAQVITKQHLGGGVWDLRLFRDNTDLDSIRQGGWKNFYGSSRASITTDDHIDFSSWDGLERDASVHAGTPLLATVSPEPLPVEDRPMILNHPTSPERIDFLVLACCMHAGARILRITRHPWNEDIMQPARGNVAINIVASLTDSHLLPGICYAGDVQPLTPQQRNQLDAKQLVVTTTFYEKQLAVWEFADSHRPAKPKSSNDDVEPPYPSEADFEGRS